ncbi:MAG: MBL fold metallo-hydrolase [Oscillospiraceae bacterium]|nr:MBL fold metallo-hydrolase [Oscillospiraceae bacterium]
MAEIIKINDNTWRIEDGMVRFFFLTRTEMAMFIDSGVSGLDLKEIAAQIAASEPGRGIEDLPQIILNTHADPDHVAGNNVFPEFYMHPGDEPLARMNGVTGRLIPIESGMIIDLGDRPLRVLQIIGHTAGSVAVLDINNRALFPGDSVQSGSIYMFGPRRDMEKLVESLDKLDRISNGFDVLYPSHDAPEVTPDIIPHLLEGAKSILEGTAEGEDTVLHGTPITWYRFPYGGFYCDRKAPEA